ncbi:MAG: hypothetical protein JTT11_08120 [Candidatus Brockarchaeota archaeon]|nr:hypothetical protein [Candidatus Brockarchaeota archaeon]
MSWPHPDGASTAVLKGVDTASPARAVWVWVRMGGCPARRGGKSAKAREEKLRRGRQRLQDGGILLGRSETEIYGRIWTFGARHWFHAE